MLAFMVKKSLVDEQSGFLHRMPDATGYLAKFDVDRKEDPKKAEQLLKSRRHARNITQQYFKYHTPYKLLPGEHKKV